MRILQFLTAYYVPHAMFAATAIAIVANFTISDLRKLQTELIKATGDEMRSVRLKLSNSSGWSLLVNDIEVTGHSKWSPKAHANLAPYSLSGWYRLRFEPPSFRGHGLTTQPPLWGGGGSHFSPLHLLW